MIPEAAVKAYLKRSLDDHLWVKGLTHKELDEAIADLDPKPKLNPGLRVHQKACFLLGVSMPYFCFFLEMGTGKSLIVLELLRYWFQCGFLRRALIFVKSDKAFSTWEAQLQRFEIDLPLLALSGSSEQKWQQLEEFGDGLVLAPYPGALYMVCTKVTTKKGKRQLAIDKKKLARLRQWSPAIVLDESTKASGDNVTFAMIKGLRKGAQACYALAGRPFGRDPTLLWSQYYLVDQGQTLGETLGLFRAAFFTEKPSYWGGPYSKEYTFKKKLEPVLAKMIRGRSITYAAAECIDLPKVVTTREQVSFLGEAEAYYQRMVKQVIAAQGNLRELKSAFLRMRQISSGFLGFKDDESGEKVEIEFQENPKLDRLLELIEEVPEGRGSVVWYEFTTTGKRVVKELRALGYKPSWLWSGTKDTRAELKNFANSKQPIIIINSKAGAYSLDGLQHTANFDFELEAPLSIIDWDQARARLTRDGQKHTVFRYQLTVKGTVDDQIYAYHSEGEDLMKALLRNPEKVLLS